MRGRDHQPSAVAPRTRPVRGRRGAPPIRQNRPDGKKVLEQLSKETGGGFYEVTKKQTIDQIYARIQEELRNQYSLGYTSDASGSFFEGASRHGSLGHLAGIEIVPRLVDLMRG